MNEGADNSEQQSAIKLAPVVGITLSLDETEFGVDPL